MGHFKVKLSHKKPGITQLVIKGINSYFRPKKQRTGISAEPFNERVIVNTDPKVKKPVHTQAFLLGIGRTETITQIFIRQINILLLVKELIKNLNLFSYDHKKNFSRQNDQ